MKQILIFDTSIASGNLGDILILNSINKIFDRIFTNARFVSAPTQEVIGKTTYKLNQSSNYSFVAGTNILSSNMNEYKQWNINYFDAINLKDVILFGVGWWQYQENPNLYTKLIYKKILSHNYIHSVRDNYRIKNVVTTGCPTTWMLNSAHCNQISTVKSDSVLFTLTDYKTDFVYDSQFIELLKMKYKNLYFWPQGIGDQEYLNKFNYNGKILNPKVSSLENFLKKRNIDYVGTRLHAGIKAMEYKKRSIIIGVDNRAAELSKDIDIPFVERSKLNLLKKKIETKWKTKLKIDYKSINQWCSQFGNYYKKF